MAQDPHRLAAFVHACLTTHADCDLHDFPPTPAVSDTGSEDAEDGPSSELFYTPDGSDDWSADDAFMSADEVF